MKEPSGSERRYAVTLASIGDAVIATDNQARVTFLNPVAEALTGWPQVEATGRPLAEVFQIINEETRLPVEDPAAKVLRLGIVVGQANHAVLLARDGREVPIDDCSAPIIDDRGKIAGVVLVFRDTTLRRQAEETALLGEAHARFELAVRDAQGRPIRFLGSSVDITDLKRAEEALRASEQRFRTFMDHAADAFFLHEEGTARVLDVNRRACESLGYTRDELLGMTPFDFDPDLTPALFEDRVHKINVGETIAFETRHRRKDGTVFPVEVRSQNFWEGGRQFFVSLARDITERKGAEEALRQSEALFRGTFENAAVGIDHVDLEGRFLRMNQKFCEILGYTREEMCTKTWMEVTHPDDLAADLELYGRLLRGELASYTMEKRFIRNDRSTVWVELTVSFHRDAAGRPSYCIAIFQDISERKRLEGALRESEARFRTLAEALPTKVWTAEPDGTIDYINSRLIEYTGLTLEQLRDRDQGSTLHPEDRPRCIEQWMRSVATGEPYEVEYRPCRADGAFRWHLGRALPLRDESGRITKWFGSITDIDDQKRAAEALREAKEAAEAASRGKDEFLANVSHEIRTPMNAILGMTELTLDTPLTDDQRQCLSTVKSAADNLLGIINDLLDFSKIEAGKLELERADFSLRAALGDTLRTLAMRAHRKGLELVCQVQPDVPDALVGDAGRLRQVWLNLIGNAIKFTEEGEVVVRVEVAVEPAPGEVSVRFAVRDTGIGIPPDKQEKVFRAFEQEDTSTTRKYGGTGLGLSIAARLVALMGGAIAVQSEPGRGSTFDFTAKFGRQPHPTLTTPALPTVVLRDLPVLVVDDNATNRRILEEWLRDWQMSPTAVGDGVAAMDVLWDAASAGRPYPLVLLDARMPHIDGLALAARIRERAALAAIRIILLTSGDRPGDVVRSREVRIDAHLLKPVQPDELLETIYRVMNGARGGAPPPAEPPPAPEPVPETAPAIAPLRILVAEDNEFSARFLERLLTRPGHTVQLASNGREALTLVEEKGFDLLFLDVHMPELDGFQVVQELRGRERTAGGHLPIIALTARSRSEDRERCLAAGMDDFLTKPVRPAELLAAIDRLVRAPGGSHGVPPPGRRDTEERRHLLDPVALRIACGDDAEWLRGMCQDFQTYVPARLAEVGEALRDRDAARLRQAAHKLCALLSAFSTSAGDVASDLEDHAAGGRLDECRTLVEQLEAMARALIERVDGLSIEALRAQAGAVVDRDRTAGP